MGMSARRTERRATGRWWRVGLAIVLVGVLATGLYVFSLFRQLTGTIEDRMERAPLLPTQTLACPPANGTAPAPPALGTAVARAPADAGQSRDFMVVRRESTTPGKGEPKEYLWAHVSAGRTRVDVVTFAPTLRLSPPGCPEQTLRDVGRGSGTAGVVAFLSGLLQVRANHVVEVDAKGFSAMRQLLDPKVIANPIGIDDAVAEAMSHIIFDESMGTDELREFAFSLRDLKTTQAHVVRQPTVPGSSTPVALTSSSPVIVQLRRALQTDSMASFT